MFPSFGRHVRLRTRAEFLAVQEQGARVSGRHMTLLGLPNAHGVDRLGVIASKKLGGAVVRNRAKRRVREVFRLGDQRTNEVTRRLDVVVIPRRELVAVKFSELQSEFDAALRKLRAR